MEQVELLDFGGPDIENCYNTGNIEGTDDVGGIVGFSNRTDGKISKCYNLGKISGTSKIAGIVGYNHVTKGTTIEKCYNVGSISGNNMIAGIGGYIGETGNEGKIINCYNCGKITGTKITGIVWGNNEKIKVISCYNVGELEGKTLYGISYKGVTANCYYLTKHGILTENATEVTSNELKELATTLDKTYNIDEENNLVTINENTSQNIWKKDNENKNNGYPILNWQ